MASQESFMPYTFAHGGYCSNLYSNEDQYFGSFAHDKRNGQGFYTFNPFNEEQGKALEYYFGNFKNDKRQGHGCYLWINKAKSKNLSEKKIFENFEEANFTSYIGYFIKNNFNKGTLISKDNNNYFVYHGTFNDDNKKEGSNCFYYSAQKEILQYGTFKDDVFVEGWVGKFSEEGEIEKLCEFKEGAMKKTEEGEAKNVMERFRNVIMSRDYFGIVFEIFKSAVEFRLNNVDGKTVIDEEKGQQLVNLCFLFNKITLFKDIEKFVNKRKSVAC